MSDITLATLIQAHTNHVAACREALDEAGQEFHSELVSFEPTAGQVDRARSLLTALPSTTALLKALVLVSEGLDDDMGDGTSEMTRILARAVAEMAAHEADRESASQESACQAFLDAH